eukprot:g48422.t1
MKGFCRICGSDLQGNQRRWIFHTSGKRRLQIVLSYVLGYIINRDGQGEFLCSKCAFMLEENLVEKERQLGQLEVEAKQLKADLENAEATIHALQEKLKKADAAKKILEEHVNEKENELVAEKQNSLKRDKTIQGLTLALKAKDKEGAEEYQSLMTEKETELAELRADRKARLMEIQKLQRALNRKEQELNDLTEAKAQLEEEVEALHLQKAKDDKTVNDIQNHIQKLGAELTEKERAMEHKYQSLLIENKQKLQSQELVIERLTDSLNNKDRLLQQALDQKHAAVDEKENEIHRLHLALREREHDLDRLKTLVANNEETINRLDGMIKEKDVELQHLLNTCKNLQRVKQELEDSRARSLCEKDVVISQLQQSLKNKTENLEDLTKSLLNQSQRDTKDVAEQLSRCLKTKEKMLEDAWAEKKQLSAEHEKEIDELLKAINSKDQLLKEASERYNRRLSELSREIQGLNRQGFEKEQDVLGPLKHDCLLNQEQILEMAQLKAALGEKDKIITVVEVVNLEDDVNEAITLLLIEEVNVQGMDLQSRLSTSVVPGTEDFTGEVAVLKDGIQRPGHAPRERTIIGEDSQQ